MTDYLIKCFKNLLNRILPAVQFYEGDTDNTFLPEDLFDDNVIGNSWDSFKKSQGEDDWQDKYNDDPENEFYEDEYYDEEEEDLQKLQDGIIRDEDAIVFEEEIPCPNCGHTITMDMFEKNYYDKVDEV